MEENAKKKKKKNYFPLFFILSMFLIAAFKNGSIYSTHYETLMPELLEKKYHEKFVFDGFEESGNGVKVAIVHPADKPEIKFKAEWNPPDVNDTYVQALYHEYARKKAEKVLVPKPGERIFWSGGGGFPRNDYVGQWEFFKKYGVKNFDKLMDENPELRNKGMGFGIDMYGPPERKDEMVRELYDMVYALRKEFGSDSLGASLMVADIDKLTQYPELIQYYKTEDISGAEHILRSKKEYLWKYIPSDGDPSFSSLSFEQFRDFDRETHKEYYKDFPDTKEEQ